MPRLLATSLLLIALAASAGAQTQPEPRYSFDMREADVRSAIDLIAQQSGIQYVLDGNVNQTVTVSLRDQTADQALRVIAKSAGLAVALDEATGIYHIKPDVQRSAARRSVPAVSLTPTLATGQAPLPTTRAGTQTSTGTGEADKDKEDEGLIRLIRLRFQDPLLFSDSAVGSSYSGTAAQYGFGGSYGGGGYGGNGNSSYGGGYGNSGYGGGGYGSNRGNRSGGYGGSSYGGSSYGGSSRSSRSNRW